MCNEVEKTIQTPTFPQFYIAEISQTSDHGFHPWLLKFYPSGAMYLRSCEMDP